MAVVIASSTCVNRFLVGGREQVDVGIVYCGEEIKKEVKGMFVLWGKSPKMVLISRVREIYRR